MTSKKDKPIKPVVKQTGFRPLKKQDAISPSVARERIESRKLSDNIFAPERRRRDKDSSVLPRVESDPGFASTTVAGAADIEELARALKDDVDEIFKFVYENIEWIPTYGSQKGALGCLIDGMGNSFDQSHLLIELLREAGYTASYQLGDLEMKEADAAAWLGTDTNIWAIVNLLAGGGIPNEEYWTGTEWKIRLTHCWVKCTISGTDYHFDPALKTYTTVSGMNLATALDYDATEFMDDATSGATVDDDYVEDMHRSNIRSNMDTLAENLVDYINTNNPDATTDDVLGGKTIDALTGTVRDTAHPELRPSTTPTTWTTDIPNTYKTVFNVTYDTIDENFYTCDIHGQRMTLMFTTAHKAELRLDGDLIATSSAQTQGSWNSVWLEVTHPYATTFADEGHWQTVWEGQYYLIAHAWGNAGRQMTEYHRKKLDQAIYDGGASTDEDVMGESLAVMWHTWNSQKSWACDVLNRMTDCSTVLQHQTGLVGHYDAPFTDLGGIVWSSVALDNDWDNVDTNDTALAMYGIAFEAGAIEQFTGDAGISTTSLIDKAVQDGQKIYDGHSDNWTNDVRPNLTNYDSGTLDDIEDWWIDWDWRVGIHEDADVTIDDFTGYGYYAISPWQGAIGIFSGELAGGFNSKAVTTSDWITQALVGGSVREAIPGQQSIYWPGATQGPGWVRERTPGELGISDPIAADPVSLINGAHLYDHVDLTVGSGSFPYGLSFQRFYSSANHLKDGPLGNGWTHNHAITAEVGSDGLVGMGTANPIQGASGIAAMYVTVDLFTDLDKPFDKFVTVALVNKWLNDKLFENVVHVNMAEGTQTFVKLPDDTYLAPLGSAATLTETSGAFTLETLQGVEYKFNTDGTIDEIDFPSGPTVSYTYTSGKLTSVSNGMGRTLTLTYTGDQLDDVSDGNSRTVEFTIDTNNNLTEVTDAEGEDTTYQYQADGLMTKIFKPANPNDPILTNTYDALNRVKEQKDAYNNVTKLYIAGSRAEEEDPTGESRILWFDHRGNIVKTVDKMGNEWTNEFDGLGRLTKSTAPEGNNSVYEYTDDHQVKKVTVKAKSGSGLSDIVNEFTYDSTWKKLKTAKDGRGNTTTYTYNATTGTLTKIERPQIGASTPTVSFTYNTRGQVLTRTDETGIKTKFEYDATKEELEKVTADEGTGRLNLVTEFGYDGEGNVTSVKDPRGKTTTFEYDDLRRLTKVTAPSPLSYQTKFTYDKNGNRTKIERETGDQQNPWQTSTAAYDIDDLLESVTDPGSQTTSFDYNSLRLLWKTTDAASRVTTRAYDEAGRIETVTDHASNVVQTNTYTDNGLLETVEDAEGNETEYEFDGFDRIKKKTFPNAKTEQLEYDANSNVTKVITRKGDDIVFSFDVLNRVATKDPDGMPKVTYTYDLAGRITKVSTPVVGGNPASGDFEYSYDTAGRLTEEEYPDGKTVEYELDANGNVTKLTYPDNYYVERVFDEINRPTGVKLNGATTEALDFDYDKLSRRTKLTYENGVETDYGFESDNDLDSLIHDFTGSSVEFTYGYNNVHELTSQEVDDSAYLWHPTSGGTTTYAAANNMNQYPTVGGTSYSYDDNGCLTDDGTFDYTYDAENQLTEADDGTTSTTYIYDPMGRQAQKNVGGTKARFIYAGMRMIAEYDGSDDIQKKYVYGAGLDEVLIELDDSDDETYLHHDQKGSIVATSDDTGAVINKYGYSPWGENDSMSGTTFGYTGQRYDVETGLYYSKARYYSPAIGRFLQPDPIGYGDGLNVYMYGHNDPNMFSDSLGLAADGSTLTADTTWMFGGGSVSSMSSEGSSSTFLDAYNGFTNTQAVGNTAPPINDYRLPPSWSWDFIVSQLKFVHSAWQHRKETMIFPFQYKYSQYKTIVGLFSTNHQFDFKNVVPKHVYGSDWRSNPEGRQLARALEPFGNFFFGAYVAAMDVSISEAVDGAGIAQFLSDLASNSQRGRKYHGLILTGEVRWVLAQALAAPWSFDNPEDQTEIKRGYAYAKTVLGI